MPGVCPGQLTGRDGPAAGLHVELVRGLRVLVEVDALDLGVTADPEADRLGDDPAEDERDRERVGEHAERGDRLLAQQRGATTENNPLVATGLIASVEKKPRYRQPM